MKVIILIAVISMIAAFQNCAGDIPTTYGGSSSSSSSGGDDGGDDGNNGNNGNNGANNALKLSNGAYIYENDSVATSCFEYRNANQYNNEGDGLYWIDPDGAGGDASLKAFCNMTIDGGGWTLLTNRPGGTVNVEACGNNTNEFVQAPCGNVDNIGFSDSYSMGGGSVRRNNIREDGEWLVMGYDALGAADVDDAYVIIHNGDLFPNSTVLVDINVTAVCNTAGACDNTDVWWKYVGDGTISLASCNGNHAASMAHRGTYGYCPDGITTDYITSQTYGNRQGFNEMKLWGQNISAGKDWQERVFVR